MGADPGQIEQLAAWPASLDGRDTLDASIITAMMRATAARITELEAQLAEAQLFAENAKKSEAQDNTAEPVAWMYERNGKVRVSYGERSEDMPPAWTETPLYAAPPNTAALIKQGRRAGVEEAVVSIGDMAVMELDIDDDDPRLARFGERIRALLTPERDTKADSDGDDNA